MHKQIRASLLLLAVVALFPTFVAAQSAGTWAYTGNLNAGRTYHTATTLENGLVLIVGGTSAALGSGGLASAELYNPSTGKFTATGSLHTARYLHTATLLNNGEVLVVGGLDPNGNPVGSAELYNPSTGTFSVTGPLNVARWVHSATLLNNGEVLIAGGDGGVYQYGNDDALASAELYNPVAGVFTTTGSLNIAREYHSATLLTNGSVLIAGGIGTNESSIVASEIYSPTSASFAEGGNLSQDPSGQAAVLLNGGNVLIAGGNVGGISELYTTSTGLFSSTGVEGAGNFSLGGVILTNGTVLVAGGFNWVGRSQVNEATAGLYTASNGTFASTGSLKVARRLPPLVLLSNGKVLATGGCGGCTTAELYEPVSTTPTGLLSIALSPTNPELTAGNAQIFAATGDFSGTGNETLASVTWTSSNTSVATISNDPTNSGHADALSAGTTTIKACAGSICGSTTLTVLPHEDVILGDGYYNSNESWEIYDDSGNRLNYGDNLSNLLANHTAVRLGNGNIFIAGGSYNPYLWEILSVASGQPVVVSSGTLQQGRDFSFGVLLSNGNVFIGGGSIPGGDDTWEIYTPAGVLVATNSLSGSRTAGATAVLLQNGDVWISGSYFTNGDACTWEVRNQNGTLVKSGQYQDFCFGGGRLQVLGNGNVFAVGGGNQVSSYEIWTPSGTFVRAGNLNYGAFNNGAASVSLSGGNEMFIFGSCPVSEDTKDGDNYQKIGCPLFGSQGAWDLIGFDANSNITFETPGSLFDTRSGARAVVTSTGSVFITGGSLAPSTWEIWTPSGTTMTMLGQGLTFFTHYSGHSLSHE